MWEWSKILKFSEKVGSTSVDSSLNLSAIPMILLYTSKFTGMKL